MKVGVFGDLDNARKISQRLNNSRVLTVDQSNRKLYKVLVGEYSDYGKALEPMDQMRLQGFDKAFIVLSP